MAGLCSHPPGLADGSQASWTGLCKQSVDAATTVATTLLKNEVALTENAKTIVAAGLLILQTARDVDVMALGYEVAAHGAAAAPWLLPPIRDAASWLVLSRSGADIIIFDERIFAARPNVPLDLWSHLRKSAGDVLTAQNIEYVRRRSKKRGNRGSSPRWV